MATAEPPCGTLVLISWWREKRSAKLKCVEVFYSNFTARYSCDS